MSVELPILPLRARLEVQRILREREHAVGEDATWRGTSCRGSARAASAAGSRAGVDSGGVRQHVPHGDRTRRHGPRRRRPTAGVRNLLEAQVLVGPALADDPSQERCSSIRAFDVIERRGHFPAAVGDEASVAASGARTSRCHRSGRHDECRQELSVSSDRGGRRVSWRCQPRRPSIAHTCPGTARELTAGGFVAVQRRATRATSSGRRRAAERRLVRAATVDRAQQQGDRQIRGQFGLRSGASDVVSVTGSGNHGPTYSSRFMRAYFNTSVKSRRRGQTTGPRPWTRSRLDVAAQIGLANGVVGLGHRAPA